MGVTFLLLLCAFLPSLIDQEDFAKTKMGYISLPSDLNAIIDYFMCKSETGDIA